MTPTETPAGARYVAVTPAGCYAAVARPDPDALALALLDVLSLAAAPAVDADAPPGSGNEGAVPAVAGDTLAELARAGLVELRDERDALSGESLESCLPALLPSLSDSGKVVLSESRQGLFLDYAGLTRDDAEQLAVIGSGLIALLRRDGPLSDDRLGVASRAVALVDPAGHSEVGFWPLYIGRYVFLLTVFGLPRFNSEPFRRLVWVLQQRYGESADA